jgi:penicillin amidase
MQKKENHTRFYLVSCCLFITTFFIAAGLSGCSDNDHSDKIVTTVETTRDDKGVWSISGTKDATFSNIFEAQGYAVATDRLWQAETFRRTARGRLAEIFGRNQLQSDVFMRITGYSEEELQAGFEALNEETKAAVLGYVAGFNRRIDEIMVDTTLLPFEFAALGLMPEQWSASDVLAWSSTMLRNFDPEGSPASDNAQITNAALLQQLMADFGEMTGFAMFNDLRWINDPDATTYIPGENDNGILKTSRTVRRASAKPYGQIVEKTMVQESFPGTDWRQVSTDLADLKNTIVDNLKRINAHVKMGSYAWTVSGDKTATGNPIIYSGPQMGFSVPAIILEGSIRAGDLNVSGMSIAGLPGVVIGRTPHHAWSMQVGHVHSSDYYIEDPSAAVFQRVETIKVAGEDEVLVPVYHTSHGPVINPMPFDPSSYDPTPANPVIAWKYAHRGYEFETISGFLNMARASSMDEFGEAIESVAVSQHFCYADVDGNIAYWMSGRDPLRPEGEYRLPQGFLPAVPVAEWDAAVLIPRSTDRNTDQGFYCGWNNKSSAGYPNSSNSTSYFFGPFHRTHVINEYLESHDNLTFEEIRDLALNIAATDSIRDGGNPWAFVEDRFKQAAAASRTEERDTAMDILDGWDGHFVKGGQEM